MPTIQGRTRKQLRQSIGYNLGAMRIGAATGTGSTTTLVDASLTTVIGGNDDHIGKWIVFTSGNNDGDIARVTDYVASTTTLTFVADAGVTVGTSTASSDTYELWDMDYSPSMIHEMINQAVIDATGHVYDPVEKLDLHSDGKQLRFDVPSGLSMVQDIYYRDKVSSTKLDVLGSTWTVGGSVTNTETSLDTEHKKQGTSSLRFKYDDATGVAAGQFFYNNQSQLTDKDLSDYDYLEFWMKSTIDIAANTFKVHLDDGAIVTDGSDKESITITEALSADKWTFVRLQLANPELDTAIDSIGLEYDVDNGGGSLFYVWLDDIRAVKNDSAQWQKVPRNLWKIDREANDIVFEPYFKNFGYKLLKLIGGDKPALLSADSTATEIDDQYIIATATALAFAASSGGPSTDPEARRQQSAFWFGLSEQSKRAFPMLTNVRNVG